MDHILPSLSLAWHHGALTPKGPFQGTYVEQAQPSDWGNIDSKDQWSSATGSYTPMRSTELGCFRSCSWCLSKALDKDYKDECMGLVPWCLNLQCKSSWILNDFLAENFGGIGMCLLVLLERSWWEGFNGIYLVRFGFRMWEILIFLKWFLSLKIQINSKKTRFWKEGRKKSVENMVTLLKAFLPFNSSMNFLSYLAVWKMDT